MSYLDSIFSKIKPALKEIETLRLTALRRRKLAFIVSASIPVISLIIFFSLAHKDYLFAGCISLFLGYHGTLFVFKKLESKPKKRFIYHFKYNVVQAIAQSLAPNIAFTPFQGISESAFKAGGHYKRRIDRYHSEDRFAGKMGKTEIFFAEIHAEIQRSSGKDTYYEDVFRGVMFVADFNKHFRSSVLIKPVNAADGVISWISKTLQSLSPHRIKLEDPEFEQHFRVFGTNDQETRYLLTPAMQQRILQLRARLGNNIILSFQKTSICITVPNQEDWFEPDLHTSVHCQKQIKTIAKQVHTYFSIVKSLDLNTRIWTKD